MSVTSKLKLFCSFGVIFFSLLYFSGTLLSDYHFIDDHELLRIRYFLQQSHNDIIGVAKQFILDDFTIRFRPFYYFHRVLETYFFEIYFPAWYLYTGILGTFTMFFLFMGLYRQNFTKTESFLFAFFVLLGVPAAIWWRLGPNETIGMLFFSAALCMVERPGKLETAKYQEVGFITCMVLASLCKESFILMFPAVLFWRVIIRKEYRNISWFAAFKSRYQTMFFLLLVAALEVGFIVAFVGTNKIGYAGIDTTPLLKYYTTLFDFIFSGGLSILMFLPLAIACASPKRKNFFLEIFPMGILLLLIVFPQAVLYAKSGLLDRYFLPGIMGPLLFSAYMFRALCRYEILKSLPALRYWFIGAMVLILSSITAFQYFPDHMNSLYLLLGQTLQWKTGLLCGLTACFLSFVFTCTGRLAVIRAFVIACLYVVMLMNVIFSTGTAYRFVMEGRETKAVFSAMQKHQQPDKYILLAADPIENAEPVFSVKTYVNLLLHHEKFAAYPVFKKQEYNDFEKMLIGMFPPNFPPYVQYKKVGELEDKIAAVQLILVYPGLEEQFLRENTWVDQKIYTREVVGSFVLYYY